MTMPSICEPTRSDATNRGSVASNDPIESVLERAEEYGRNWSDDMYSEERVEQWIGLYAPKMKEIREKVNGRHDEYRCMDPHCGFGSNALNALLLPHQVVHCIIYHAEAYSQRLYAHSLSQREEA